MAMLGVLASCRPASAGVKAQGPPQDLPDLAIDATARREVIDALLSALKKEYVYPKMAASMAADIRKRSDAKEYEAIIGSKAFASTLTDHLRAISEDKHLEVHYSHQAIPDSGKTRGPSPEEEEQQKKFAASVNFGFEKVERMEGNIGYLDIRGFLPPEVAGETAAAAMTFLANGDALIVDLRHNDGGEPAMVAFLTTYLFGAEPVHLNDLYNRREDRTHQWWTLPYVPGKRFGPDKPVYVLTSKETFSAAEEFAYNLQNLKRATIVGETTGGGAHPRVLRRLTGHFEAFIPNQRAINPISGTNWERIGVKPEIAVPADQALKAAQVAASEAISKGSDDPRRVEEFRKTIDRLKKEIDEARGPAAQERGRK